MRILHIANDYSGSKVHSQLIKILDSKNIDQVVYSPVRNEDSIGKNFFNGINTRIIYSFVIKPYYKYVYHIKRKALFKDILSHVDINSIDICHAATLFSDGGLAYDLYRRYNVPSVVAVRNTDVNIFMNFMPHTWLSAVKILLSAKKIFFISAALKEKFNNHFIIKPILKRIQDKCELMPNGIDDYFLDNICHEKCCERKIIYVGDFSNNKNVARLCSAVIRLRRDKGFENTTLTIVGGGNNETNEVEKIISRNPEIFKFLGKVYDKEKLCKIFRSNSMFAMPSIYETFGLVYVEALSQNLPVLYTRGQGIDGLFSDKVGIGVDPLSEDEIYNALKCILQNRSDYSNNDIDFENFRWKYIAEKYIGFYRSVLSLEI